MHARTVWLGLVVLLSGTAGSATLPARGGWDLSLVGPDEPGPQLVLVGTVLSLPDSQPVRGARLHIFHQDTQGHYGVNPTAPPRLAGDVRTTVLGQFRIRTVLPGDGEGVPHIHYRLSGPGIESRLGATNLCRAQGAGSDSAYARLPWMVTIPPGGDFTYVEPQRGGGYRGVW